LVSNTSIIENSGMGKLGQAPNMEEVYSDLSSWQAHVQDKPITLAQEGKLEESDGDPEAAINILKTWVALEVLEPTTFDEESPGDLVASEEKLVRTVRENVPLPWENGGEKASKDNVIFYHIIIGSIDFAESVQKLEAKYGDKIQERKEASGRVAMASLVLDQEGRPSGDGPGVSISSFAWALPKALEGDLEALANWPVQHEPLEKKFSDIFRKTDEEMKFLPVTKEQLAEAYEYLISALDLEQDNLAKLVRDDKIIIRIEQKNTKKKDEDKAKKASDNEEDQTKPKFPLPLLFNSFYINDLIKARDNLIKAGDMAADEEGLANLLRYLRVKKPKERHDILGNDALVAKIVAPCNIPLARWPSPGRHPLVLLQQTAVNLAMSRLRNGGILAVNGPPGTGKTTLLRDIVAATVYERAKAMLAFDDPANAFKHKCEKNIDGYTANLYELDAKLKGFEIVVASSNNKAVENISSALPGLDAIAKDANSLRYFNILSDIVFPDNENKTWGMISAVLGNSNNCSNVRDNFWYHDDYGLMNYLDFISGRTPYVKEKDKHGRVKRDKNGNEIKRKPKFIAELNPPNSNAALKNWKVERANFEATRQRCEAKLKELERLKGIIDTLDASPCARYANGELHNLLVLHQKKRPNLFKRILKLSSFQKWNQTGEKLAKYQEYKNHIETSHKEVKPHFINESFFTQSSKKRNCASPWCDAAAQSLRDELFIAAMKLHQAFVEAAAKPIRHNLNSLMPRLGKRDDQMDADIKEKMPDLFSTFFLVVPVISTTFASVHKLLKHIPNDTLGLLLIDEAGQALPQAAVGAIMRCKRVVVTGDPLQIEPIVTLPTGLTKALCKEFKVKTSFNAPKASAQTLADAVSPYYSSIMTSKEERELGVPLLVHRRCEAPMFGISNLIAYEGLMVHEKAAKESPIRKCLGGSKWFDIEGKSKDKWCEEEGVKVIELLTKLKNNWVEKPDNKRPDIYIVSPFRNVVDKMKKLIKGNHNLYKWLCDSDENWLKKRVGTLHTFQGREAEAVILVLGAQRPSESGARIWAGETPNLLNVAVTRAKEAFYVVGNRSLWGEVGVFQELDKILPQ
jgi:hypothetical protein